ncbi:MAG TPA: glycerol kinase GlpK [Chitinophagaceae bacterium]|nr:glycerol kinase GlpK [Chitinophagaceae bacterium]
MEQFILALDQGTTSSRAIVFDHSGNIKASAQKEFNQFFPKPGWVEHDANEIWSTQAGVAAEALTRAGVQGEQIAGIGITNQRETTVVWDRETGKPLCHAIVWQDRRTADFCDQLRKDGHDKMIRDKTGLIVDAYFSATKIRWILDNVEGARKKAEAGKLAFGTIDTWLLWNFTRGKVHVTDVTNASRTMLFNIHDLKWDEDLMKLLDIPASLLPEVRSCSEVYGHTSGQFLAHQIPLAGIAGDQQAALFGQMCIQPGMVKNTYGTGCFMVMNTGDKAIPSKNNLLTTIGWKIKDKTTYALEGSIFIGGAVVQWLRDGLGIIRSSGEVEQLAERSKDNDGVYLVPAFAGLGAPHWNQHALGTMVGITRGTTASHIARAALESIAYQTFDVLKAMEADSGLQIKELRVDGGATADDLLMQFQADLLQTDVVRPQVTETTALGAAYLAGLATGFWDDIQAIKAQWQQDRLFSPEISPGQVGDLLKGWQRAVDTTIHWAELRS